jgi:hypothetical protein
MTAHTINGTTYPIQNHRYQHYSCNTSKEAILVDNVDGLQPDGGDGTSHDAARWTDWSSDTVFRQAEVHEHAFKM